MKRRLCLWRYGACAVLIMAALVAGGCPNDDTPSEPAADSFITLRTANDSTSLPADGLSTVGIEARIDSRAVKKGRAIRFEVDRGVLMAPGESEDQSVDIVPDSTGRAIVTYRSDTTVGPLIVTATVVEMDGTSVVETQVSIQIILELTDPDTGSIIRFLEAPATAPADGATALRFVVEVASEVDDTTEMVTFRTTAGSFTRGEAPELTAQRAIDDSRQATVLLYAANEITEATVSAATKGHTTQTRLRFLRAHAEEVLVEVDPFRLENDGMTTVTVRLIRDVGTSTKDAVVRFRPEDVNGDSFGTFRNVMRSDAAGQASAVLHREQTGEPGRGRIIVTVDDSDAVGTAEVELQE